MRGKIISSLILFVAAGLALPAIESFKVTGVWVEVSEREFTGTCPHIFTFTGHITANREGTVCYRWVRSDGIAFADHFLTFAAAGSKTVPFTWELGGVMGTFDDCWVKLEIRSPNARTSNPALFDLKCIPRVVLPSYSISGTLESGPEGSKIQECQVRVVLRRIGGATLTKAVELDAAGRGSYTFSGPIIGSGSYRLTVEKIPDTCDPDRYNPCFNGTEPASRSLELSPTNLHAIDQNFTILWDLGWNMDRCW